MRFEAIHSAAELSDLVKDVGFLPFFANSIPGFSVEESTPRKHWFSGEVEGPWEWKGPVITTCKCAYGKLFRGKAGFVSKRWFPDFANYRRGGCEFHDNWARGLVSRQDKQLYDILNDHESLLSTELKYLCGFSRNGRKGFDGIMARLQAQSFVVIVDFEYRRDKRGLPYGWGVARYATADRHFGQAFSERIHANTPEKSQRNIVRYLSRFLPDATEEQIVSLIG